MYFKVFYKQKLEQKGGHFAEREFIEVPYRLAVQMSTIQTSL